MANKTWQEALDRLKAGNEKFVQDKMDNKLQDSSRRASLTGGQAPYAIVLGCADSRVVPELAFDTGLGEIFVIRVAGNVATKSAIASIEYAVAHLNTKLIVVLSHQSCGAVTAAVAGGDNGPNLNHLLSFVGPAVESSAGEAIDTVAKKNAVLNGQALIDNSEIIKNAEGLKIVPAFYNMDSGKVDFDLEVA